ncbi:hypothetical protein BL250_08370 [Erwinia sp. OLTSP20]|uniref:DUF4431 domain-containing protein n=1 Tax=unclassified Erwinia TaxID=2622719 RepID=UPI000C1777F9|nr:MULTISPECIES: DUF4431 domain-containing protein [unclassified Erwinia]PIJ50255.1 hypothetical protein BV501_09300 [Erwinia sp. OAMSP11]PIJ72093.1 hypothetical protein BK416_10200 [Erwinia sp. OLSSP12]PIJ81384.1 hypothetical protein BLD47_09025 [Erwinia sp. OLCASP19]PIJ84090.1 hypothetical protein BLD46_08605 [Erwinia sp. OLMTSP26]PIJ85789.1 hypothetical protein BLD49_09825 [Erwinia sp. OLMDSP33]
MNGFRPFSLLFLSVFFMTTAAGAAETYHYQPEVVTLSGQVSLQTFDGPPGYGDGPDDQQVKVAVLELDKPITVMPVPGVDINDPNAQQEDNVSDMQIVNRNKINLPEGCYVLTGTLMHQVNANHYTPVLLQVTSAKPASSCH